YYFLFDTVGPDSTPSRSTIASWLHELGFVDANARKRPRSSYKGLRVKMCVWLGVSRGLDLAFLNAD
ncbi:hypothetical protein ACN4EB_10845, partial [Corynebacterium macclintockiae]|uniref:hypothetical protein n=1 Tax=Corynebacterium macclintockiae TaxID=2913501 RepID=UPI003EB79FD6